MAQGSGDANPRPLLHGTGRRGENLVLAVLRNGCAILENGRVIRLWEGQRDSVDRAVDAFLKMLARPPGLKDEAPGAAGGSTR